MNRQKRYIIYAPPLRKSQGVRALYKLYDVLRARGYEAFIFCPRQQNEAYQYIEKFDDDMRAHDIMVYPETTSGNPLRFQNIARYVLYYAGALGGETSYHPSETVFVWDKKYFAGENLLWMYQIDELFKDENLLKTQDCCFVYKGGKWKDVPELEGLLEINMDYPKSREELAQILKTTGTLYSFDAESAILAEALCCGAKVKVVTKEGFDDLIYEPQFSDAEIERQINNFIELTQAMNYTGPLEKYPLRFKMKVARWRRYILLRLFQKINKLCPGDWLEKKIFRLSAKLKRHGIFLD